MKIYLIRHFSTEWNKDELLQGKKDIPISNISNNDRMQMEKNINILEGQKYDIVLTSTLKRTKQTANKYGFNRFQIEPLLDELDFGVFEGGLKSNLIKDTKGAWIESPRSLVLGESLQGFEDRLKFFLSTYGKYKKILIFGHGAVIRALISIQKNNNIDLMNKMEIKTNSITIL